MANNVAQLLWTLRRGSPAEQAQAGHQIYQLESKGGHSQKNDGVVVEALVAEGAIGFAIDLMATAAGPVQEVAALILRPICQRVEAHRARVLSAGVLPPLLQMLHQGPTSGPAHYAAGLIVNLAAAQGGPKQLRERGALPPLMQMAQDRRAPLFGRFQAIDALGWLARNDEECARVVIAAPRFLQMLVTDLSNPDVAEAAACTLGHVGLQKPWGLEAVQRVGAIPGLIAAFHTADDALLDRAVHALLQMTATGDAVWAETVQAGGLSAIVAVLEKRDVPGCCVQSCAACIVYWLWKKEDLRGPIRAALEGFVRALGPAMKRPVEAERVTALKGLLYLVDGVKFQEPAISAALVEAGAIPVLEAAGGDPRPAVQILAVRILHALFAAGEQSAARVVLGRIDVASPMMGMLTSDDSAENETGAELLTQLLAYEHRTDPWWTDPPTLVRPFDILARRLVDAGVIPICVTWMRDATQAEAIRSNAALALTRICCFRVWGQLAVQQAWAIQSALEVLVGPNTPPDLRRACAYLLKNAVAKNEHATWALIQAGGVPALFSALELSASGDLLSHTLEGLALTLHAVWEIVPQRGHVFPALKAFVDRIANSAQGSRERLLLGLFTLLDPEVDAVDASLQDAFVQAGALPLLVPMLNDPTTSAQIWAAKILRVLVVNNQATKRSLNVAGGLTRLFEALNGGNPAVQEAVLRCLGEELYQAGELSVVAINKMSALKLLTQCVVHGEPNVQERAMWVIGRMCLQQAIVARLLGQGKPRRLISILIQKVKDAATQPTMQYYAVYALEFLTVHPEDNVKLALKGGMVPIYMDVIKSSAAEDRTRIRALSTITDNSRAWYKFKGKCSRSGIYKVTWKLKDDPAASVELRAAALQAYKDMWKAMGEGVFGIFCAPFGNVFSMRSNIMEASRL